MFTDVLSASADLPRESAIPGFVCINMRVLEDTADLSRRDRLLLKRMMRQAEEIVETIDPGLLTG